MVWLIITILLMKLLLHYVHNLTKLHQRGKNDFLFTVDMKSVLQGVSPVLVSAKD